MNRTGLRDISLASLAVSVSATAILGVSSAASADSSWYCNWGNPCTTRPQDDPYSYWSWDGTCGIGEGSPCACVAQAYAIVDGQWIQHTISSDIPACYGED